MDAGSQRAVAACELLHAALWRHLAEVSGSAVEAGGTGRKLGPHRVSSKTPDSLRLMRNLPLVCERKKGLKSVIKVRIQKEACLMLSADCFIPHLS